MLYIFACPKAIKPLQKQLFTGLYSLIKIQCMKKCFMKPLVLILFAALTLVACKKNKDVPAFTKENILGKWKTGNAYFRADGSSQETDVTAEIYTSCQKDDIIELKADYSLLSQDAGEVCNPSNSYEGSWDMGTENNINYFVKGSEVFEVTKWDGTTLALSAPTTYIDTDGTLTLYFTKQ
jgi:hypothetical protein